MRRPRTTTKSSPRSPQLEKAHAWQQRPNAAKNFKKKKKRNREPVKVLKKKKKERTKLEDLYHSNFKIHYKTALIKKV